MRWTVAVVLMMMLAGCAGDDDAGDGTTTDPTQTQTTSDPTTTEATQTTSDATTSQKRDPVTWEVEVRDNSFSPDALTIQVGDTVRWVQSGSNPHTVTEDEGDWDSHPDCASFADGALGNCMADGDMYEQTFDTVGTVGYHCKLHGSPGGGMAGSIEVLERHDATP